MNIEKTLVRLIANQAKADIGDIEMHYHLIDDIGMDSLDMVELITAVEKEFGIEIQDDEIENILTVEAIVKYVKQKLNE